MISGGHPQRTGRRGPGFALLCGLGTVVALGALPARSAAPGNTALLDQLNRTRPMVESYGGLVLDQTLTPAGQDFYQAFVAAWRDRPRVDRYALVIQERPSARQGSQLTINQGHRRVFQARLPARRAAAREFAERVADYTYQTLVEGDLQALLFRDPDLAREELQ